MPFEIDRRVVEHIARLARLKMAETEIERYRADLSEILEYVQQLNQLDTSDVPPTAHPLTSHSVIREDEVGKSYSPNQALGNAPGRDGPFFTLPRVLEHST